ncbi:hypothetical protein GOODEAATRI_017798 [Goodea atripinnis]|uniref:Uncharacterized protein n=1 Tax=Goodea atripinnis TaxID=208336 RepID=A0ABV0PEY1_9TELE
MATAFSLGLEASGKKRKHDDDKGSKDREEKTKNKKDKKDKKKEEESAENWDEKTKVKKEEEEHKVKPSRKSLEEDKSFHSKKDEDEKYKYSKKDEKCHYSREDEDRNNRYRSSSRDEEYRYCNRRDVDNKYDDYSKYGTKDTEDKYKHERCSDARSKYDMERDAGKPKAEREFDKRGMKPDVRKSEPSLKPYDLPKIFCGPSPAMRAKLRKQALEAGKAPLSASMGTSFGKFTWKKRENQLAKEAEEVAAEFIKEDEMAVREQSGEDEDSFSKSMAAAKEIAEKLAGEQLKPPLWYQPGQGQIRPNLRAPVAQLRRPALAGKPASLNTFLNIRPQSTDGSLPGPSPRAPYRLPNPQISHSKPGPLVKPSIVSQVSPVPLRTESSEIKSPLPQVKAATSQAPTAPVISSKATPSQPAMIKIVSDATTAPTAKAVCPEISVPAFQSKQTPSAYTEDLPQSQPTTSEPETQIRPQTKPAPLEPTAEAPSKSPPQIQEETQAEPQIGQDANSHQDVTPEPQPKPKPSPRTRGKAAPMKKNPPAAAPVRQTRSQTRYQTRQQQSEPELEQESAAGDRNTTVSETKGLESSDAVKETDPPGTEVTPETLGLPSEMTSLDYNFSFE